MGGRSAYLVGEVEGDGVACAAGGGDDVGKSIPVVPDLADVALRAAQDGEFFVREDGGAVCGDEGGKSQGGEGVEAGCSIGGGDAQVGGLLRVERAFGRAFFAEGGDEVEAFAALAGGSHSKGAAAIPAHHVVGVGGAVKEAEAFAGSDALALCNEGGGQRVFVAQPCRAEKGVGVVKVGDFQLPAGDAAHAAEAAKAEGKAHVPAGTLSPT